MKKSVISALAVMLSVLSYYPSCMGQNEVCRDGSVRLVGGETTMGGRVEVCRTGEWRGIGYCGQMETEASVICKQLGYSQTGAEAHEGSGVTMKTDRGLSCSGDESRVSECSNTCGQDCCQENMTLEVRCKPVECSGSIVIELSLGVVCGLLLTLLLATSIAVVILGVKLKRTRHKGRYESEPHNYVEQHIGQAQVSETSGPTYDDPIVWKQKGSSAGQKDGEYINTEKCIAYRQNPTTTTTFCTLSLPQSYRPASQADEYEIMQQLHYKGDNYLK